MLHLGAKHLCRRKASGNQSLAPSPACLRRTTSFGHSCNHIYLCQLVCVCNVRVDIYKYSLSSTSRQFLQIIQTPIKEIRVPTIRITIRILPNSLIPPATGNRPRATPIPGQHKRTIPTKSIAIPRARSPPIIRAINQRPPATQALILVDETRDPANHRTLAKPVAGIA